MCPSPRSLIDVIEREEVCSNDSDILPDLGVLITPRPDDGYSSAEKNDLEFEADSKIYNEIYFEAKRIEGLEDNGLTLNAHHEVNMEIEQLPQQG
jgi:hypothetical protein